MPMENCSICDHQKKKSVPVVWCPHCLESLCSSCELQHRVMRLSRDHVTIPYEEYNKLPPFIRNVDLYCQYHNEKYHYFCRSHDELCCVKCLSKFHKECDDTPEIDEHIHNVQSSAAFEDVWRDLEDTYDAYKVAVETGKNNVCGLETKKNKLVKSVKERTNQLIDQLKTIENQTLTALDIVVTETTNKIEITNKTLQSKETQLKTMIGHKTGFKTNASKFQTFIGMRYIKSEVKNAHKSFQDILEDGDLCEWDVRMEEHENVIFRVKRLGDIKTVKEKKAKLTLIVDRANRAQINDEGVFPPKLTLTKQFQFEGFEGTYYGSCYLPNGGMALADSSEEEVTIVQNDGSLLSSIKFTDRGIDDVTVIDEKHIAASNPKAETISIIEVYDSKVIKTLQTKSDVTGIKHHHGDIYFCVPKRGIMKINITTEKVEKVYDDASVCEHSRIDMDGNRLCYTRLNDGAVVVLNSDYKVIFEYKNPDVSEGPMGISFDQQQNIFVSNISIHNLLLISRDGDKIETLDTGAYKLIFPTGVHYCVNTKSLLVVCKFGDVRKYFSN